MNKFLTFTLLICTPAFHTLAQETLLSAKPPKAPLIDGILSMNEWTFTDSVSSFFQLEPSRGQASTENTTVFVASDEHNLYVAFRCYQSHQPTANIQTRDQLRKSDDAILLVLDTHSDNRSGYCFIVNPIGTQTDFKITDDGRNKNYDWDGTWISATGKLEGGWCVEIAIPYKNIRYSSSTNFWGINFGRIIRHNAETCWWSDKMTDDFRISQGGRLKHLQTPAKTDRFLLTPYSSLRWEKGTFTHGKHKTNLDGGIDMRYTISPNMNVNATINPDFASIEGDRQKIDLTGWEISFPEKRVFFQEGNELYDMRYQLFYSRRIGDINYGGQYTGKAGKYSMNLMSVQTVENPTQNDPSSFYTVARIKRDVLKSSTIGFTFADKSSDTAFVRNFGLDWVFNPGQYWKITGQLIGSTPGNFIENSGGFLRVAHESNKHHVHVRYSELGRTMKDNFNKTGFLSDDNRKEVDSDLEYTFWMNNKTFKYISLATMNNAYWSQDGHFRSSKFREHARFYFSTKISADFYFIWENRQVDNKYILDSEENQRYTNYYLRSSLGYNTDESSHVQFSFTLGENFGRDMKIWEGATTFMPFKRFSINYSIAKLEFDPNTVENLNLRLEHSTVLNILSADYYFTNNLWIHLFAQSDSYQDKIYLYGKFGWRFKPPFGGLYLIYSLDDYYDHQELQAINNNTLFLKLTYPISF